MEGEREQKKNHPLSSSLFPRLLTVKLVVAQLDLAIPVRPLQVDVQHALRHPRLRRHLGLELEGDGVRDVDLHPPRHAAVGEDAADRHVAPGGHQVGPKLVGAVRHFQRGRTGLGGHVGVAHEEGVADRKVLVEGLGEVKAQALKQVGLEGHWQGGGGRGGGGARDGGQGRVWRVRVAGVCAWERRGVVFSAGADLSLSPAASCSSPNKTKQNALMTSRCSSSYRTGWGRAGADPVTMGACGGVERARR